MMKKWTKKLTALALIFTLMLTLLPATPAEAASKYTGTYQKVYKLSKAYKKAYPPIYTVTINKVTKNKIRFQVEYLGINGSPIYQSNVITSKLKSKASSFKWKDTWGNSGKGKIKLYKNYIKIKMVQTKTAKWNRSTLDTTKYLKLKKKNNTKKVYRW